MGILNITPDSFSDGGHWFEPQRAIEHGLAMLDAGADLIDLGAESTRPGGGVYGDGATKVEADEELDRLLPVLVGLRRQTSAPLSVDTRKGPVAAAALDHGADLINDVSCLRDASLAAAVVAAGCPLLLMHSRGEIDSMQDQAHYDDPAREVRAELARAMARAERSGVSESQILLDPGIGFAKRLRHNLSLLRRLDELATLGRPVVVGASRKSFIGRITGAAPSDRLPGSLAAAAWAVAHGAAMLRVHDVLETAQFLSVWTAVDDAREVAKAAEVTLPT